MRIHKSIENNKTENSKPVIAFHDGMELNDVATNEEDDDELLKNLIKVQPASRSSLGKLPLQFRCVPWRFLFLIF